MADRLTPGVTDGHTDGRKKLELMAADSLNAYDFIQLDNCDFKTCRLVWLVFKFLLDTCNFGYDLAYSKF